MPIQQITPNKAKEVLDQNSNAIYLDVRSIPEFDRGHVPQAYNIPLLHQDEDTGQLIENPDFIKVVEATFNKDQILLVGCQAGGRSQKACNALTQAGYQNLSNVMGGWGGGRDPQTGASIKGWSQLDLPVDQNSPHHYESILSKVK
ncbi:MAG: hypothetical protein JNK65_07875 [Deltaproteobacteria bacterium]|nr:hypothetical protein [Deltaproteobacteria bacterium]